MWEYIGEACWLRSGERDTVRGRRETSEIRCVVPNNTNQQIARVLCSDVECGMGGHYGVASYSLLPTTPLTVYHAGCRRRDRLHMV